MVQCTLRFTRGHRIPKGLHGRYRLACRSDGWRYSCTGCSGTLPSAAGPVLVLTPALAFSWARASTPARPSSIPRHFKAQALRTQSTAPPKAMAEINVLVPIAENSEEIETACIQDTLVRAGAKVTVASVMPDLQVKMSRGLKVVADCSIKDCVDKEWDAIALPGGMPGAEHLRDCEELTKLLKTQCAKGKVTAAVCASPAVVFATHGLLPPSGVTCYPNPKFKDMVPGWEDTKAVTEGYIITSQGPGTSLQFALKIVEKLFSAEKAEEIAKAMLTTVA